MSPVVPLVERLAAEVTAATERIHALQNEAAKVFLGQEQRFVRFLALTDRIHAILQPRLAEFTEVSVFKDIHQKVTLETRGPEGRGISRCERQRSPFHLLTDVWRRSSSPSVWAMTAPSRTP